MTKVLCIGSHADDIELGCGGTIERYFGEYDFYYAIFSEPGEIRKAEMFESAYHLHIYNPIVYDNAERLFHKNRNLILQSLYDLRQEIKPDIVLTHSTNDTHQDHQTLTQEAKRIFKNCTLLGYELPWNDYSTSNDLFVTLTESQISRKIEALKMYQSQQHKPFINEDTIRSLARVRGLQAGVEYAEMFEVIRIVI